MTGPVRALAPDEHDAFRLARLVAAEQMPYFMSALFAASPLADPGLGTFAVDRFWRLYMDPALLIGPGAWTVQTAGAVLLHELGHLLRDHAGRATALPQPYRHLPWNLAGDAEINDDLVAAGIMLPQPITPAALGLHDGGLAEDYYTALVPPTGTGPLDLTDDDDGGGGCGSGAGCPAVPGELTDPDHPTGAGISSAEGDFVRRRVAMDVTVQIAAKGRGTVPAGLARWASRAAWSSYSS